MFSPSFLPQGRRFAEPGLVRITVARQSSGVARAAYGNADFLCGNYVAIPKPRPNQKALPRPFTSSPTASISPNAFSEPLTLQPSR
jgi:hypothetical protein